MKMKNCVAVKQSTLQKYPNVEAIPIAIFEVGKAGDQTVVMAVAPDGNQIVTNNKIGIGIDFEDACGHLISTAFMNAYLLANPWQNTRSLFLIFPAPSGLHLILFVNGCFQ